MKIDPKKIARMISEDPDVPSDPDFSHFDDTEDEYMDPDEAEDWIWVVQRAEEIARSAHEGQLYGDKITGVPYINHSLAVKDRAGEHDHGGELALVSTVALLHDVIEDTSTSSQDLLNAGIPPIAVAAIEAITRNAGEKYFAYIKRLSNNPIARIVKIADLEENLSSLPKGNTLEGRYLKALEILGNPWF
jgi:(p)ppGpp synthase/HD superfamily hydrolase